MSHFHGDGGSAPLSKQSECTESPETHHVHDEPPTGAVLSQLSLSEASAHFGPGGGGGTPGTMKAAKREPSSH